MIIYNVTTQIDPGVHDEWMKWMKSHHIPAVMKTGCFIEYRMLKVLGEEAGGHTYSIQYTCKAMNDYHEYEQRHAPALRAEYIEKYKDKFVNFRTLLEVVS
jgi:hypothetical protein